MEAFPAPPLLTRSIVALSGSNPSRQAHTSSKFNFAASLIQEWVMLFPSPTYTTYTHLQSVHSLRQYLGHNFIRSKDFVIIHKYESYNEPLLALFTKTWTVDGSFFSEACKLDCLWCFEMSLCYFCAGHLVNLVLNVAMSFEQFLKAYLMPIRCNSPSSAGSARSFESCHYSLLQLSGY